MPIAYIIISSMPIVIGDRTSRLPCVSTLVEDGNALMLFETGFFGGEGLTAGLKKLGFAPKDITHVFTTHFHGDHAGGNDLFERSVKIASLDEYHFSLTWLSGFRDSGDRENYIRQSFPFMLPSIAKDRSALLEKHLDNIPDYWWNKRMEGYAWHERETPFPSYIVVQKTPGHTPHHTSYIISGKKMRLIIAGDAISHRKSSPDASLFEEPHIDSDGYRKSYEMLTSLSGVIIPGHDRPFVRGKDIRVGRKIEF